MFPDVAQEIGGPVPLAYHVRAAEFGPDVVREWYRPADLLSDVREHVIPPASTLPETISLILAQTQLLQAPFTGG